MPIYTRTGDKGKTSLGQSKRVSKDSLVIEALGELDELNSILAFASGAKETGQIVKKIQSCLFHISSELAQRPSKNFTLAIENVQEIENIIDDIERKLPALRNFIFPGGSKISCCLFFARAVCRRAERKMAALNKKIKVRQDILSYINRLSDLLFVLARYANKISRTREEIWKP